MMDTMTAKRRARVLKAFLKEHHIELAHGLALEAMARLEGHRNWATLLAACADAAALSPPARALATWPSYVFHLDEDPDTFEESVYFFPHGTSLGDEAVYDAYGGLCCSEQKIAVPEGFLLDSRVVATAVHSCIPRVDRYGLPWFSNEDLAVRFFRESLGVAVLEPLNVTLYETGDDSGAKYWFEAKVHPTLARLLAAAQVSGPASRD